MPARTTACATVLGLVEARRMPNHWPAAGDPFVLVNTTGFADVPVTLSAPATTISTREVFAPEPWESEPDADCTWTPAWIVSVWPAGTVTSPWTTYGLLAAV